MKSYFHKYSLTGSIALAVALTLQPSAESMNRSRPQIKANHDATPSAPRLVESYGELPLQFEVNQGQTDRQVKFLAHGSGYAIFLTPTETVLALRSMQDAPRVRGEMLLLFPTLDPDSRRPAPFTLNSSHPEIQNTELETETEKWAVVRMKLAHSNPWPRVTGVEELPGRVNYFLGDDPSKWLTNIPIYARVEYHDVYPGVDLVYYGSQGQFEYDFIIAPHADPRAITFELDGEVAYSNNNSLLQIGAEGELVLHASDGVIRFRKPSLYQDVNGVRQEVTGGYVLKGAHRVGFQVGAYDTTKPLVIDPVLLYSTYLGGSTIAVDSGGNAYVTGGPVSTIFPTSLRPFGGNGDAFVAKLNPTGSALVYSTYLGGNGFDQGSGVAVDSAGNLYVAGGTESTNFPTTAGAFQTALGGSRDVFVAKLDPSGSLLYSTYLGGNNFDHDLKIAVGADGAAYVTGETFSTNFPTKGAYQSVFGGNFDAFVTKLDPSKSGAASLVYSTYLGGTDADVGNGIAVDAAGNAYVTGGTRSTNFPTSLGTALQPYQPSLRGLSDAFVTKLNANGSLLYSTYLGGTGGDGGSSIAVDAAGNAYVTGITEPTNFPTTPLTALQPSFNGGSFDAFVTKLDPSKSGATSLVYSTYLGGSGDDAGLGIAVDAAGNAYVTGFTSSTNFRTTAGAFQLAFAGVFDAFVTKLDPAKSLDASLIYSTYLGGSGDDAGQSIALDTFPNPNAYVTGRALSTNFPTTQGSLQPTFGGFGDGGFIAKIGDQLVLSIANQKASIGGSVDIAVNLSDGAGIAGLQLTLTYDATLLSVTGVNKGSLPTDHGLITNIAVTGRIQAAIVSTSLSSLKSGSGSVVVVTFKVNASAPTSTTLSLSGITASNVSGTNIPISGRGGTLEIIRSRCLGDVNGDSARDVLDVVRILRHIVGLEPLTGDSLAAADVNGDGKVDILDVVRLLNHIVGNNPLPACTGTTSALRLSKSSARPGEILVATGGVFDPTAPTFLVFTDQAGSSMKVRSGSVTPTTVEVRVPVLLDLKNFKVSSGMVSVSVLQGSTANPTVFGPVPNFQIAELPQTGLSPGSVALEVLDELQKLLESTAQNWETIGIGSSGLVDTSPLRTRLRSLQEQFLSAQISIQRLVNREVQRVNLGEIVGRPTFLDLDSLALLDRVLVAYLLGSGNPNQSAVRPSGKVYYAASDPLESLRDQFNQLIGSKIPEDVLAFANKYKETAGVLIGVSTLGALAIGGAPIEVALAAGAVMGGIVWSVGTLVPAGIAASLQGGSNMILKEQVEVRDFEKTIGFLGESVLDLIISDSVDLVGAQFGELGRVGSTVINTASDLRSLFNRSDPSSLGSKIAANFGTITNNLKGACSRANASPSVAFDFYFSFIEGSPIHASVITAKISGGPPGGTVQIATSWGTTTVVKLNGVCGGIASGTATIKSPNHTGCFAGSLSAFFEGRLIGSLSESCF